MKIALSVRGTDLDAAVEPRFARCSCFLVVDSDTLRYEAVEIPTHVEGSSKTGVGAALLLAGKEADAVLTGNLGVAAHQTLADNGIRVYGGARGSVRNALEAFTQGRLPELSLERRPFRHPGRRPARGLIVRSRPVTVYLRKRRRVDSA
jgi:predicted Fe-Mo cluster-binding NifX family protein